MTIKHHQANLNAPLIGFPKLAIIYIFGLFASSPILASEKLDIRPYETADECSTDIPQIRVTVNDVGSGGILSVELYDNPKHFLKRKGASAASVCLLLRGNIPFVLTMKNQERMPWRLTMIKMAIAKSTDAGI